MEHFRVCSFVLLMLVCVSSGAAQSFALDLNGRASTGFGSTLTFGIHANATLCEDLFLGERNDDGPPPPPFAYCFRWVNPRISGLCDNNGCFDCGRVGSSVSKPLDLRSFVSSVQSDTFRCFIQPDGIGGGYPFRLSWSKSDYSLHYDNIVLKYTGSTAGSVTIDMLTDSAHSITDPTVVSARIIGTGPHTQITPPVPLDPPNLVFPAINSVSQPLALTLEWTGSSGATAYRLQVSTDSMFISAVHEDTTANLSRTIGPLHHSTRYFWRVQAFNASGSSQWSEIWIFSTIVLLSGEGTATIDGVISEGEWSNAGYVDFDLNIPEGGTTPARLYIMNDAINLYLAVKVARSALDPWSSLGADFDSDNDGMMEEGDDGFLFYSPAEFFDAFRTTEPPCPESSLCGFHDRDYGGTNDGAGMSHNDGNSTVSEIYHPLMSRDTTHDFALGDGDVISFFFLSYVICTESGCIHTYVPRNSILIVLPPSHLITATAGSHGSISPSGSVTVAQGTDTTFTIVPSAGYHVDSVFVDGSYVGAPSSYTFIGVTTEHTISATFAINSYRITVTQGGGGTISPGTTSVNFGANQTFTITPDAEYHVADVIVDGVNQGAVASFTFTDVTANHTITAEFALNVCTITAVSGANGNISPSGSINVECNGDVAFTITPDADHHIDSIIVDGTRVDSTTSYTFVGVTSDHAIAAYFSVNIYTLAYNVRDVWNLLSIPLNVSDYNKHVLFPTSASSAWAYEGHYAMKEQLVNGVGYWLKFSGAQSMELTGSLRRQDTVNVSEGWNFIGSISEPISISNITSVPPGIVTSEFFGYEGHYLQTNILEPAKGYCVNVSQPGKLILSSSSHLSAESRIKIVPTSELPPAAPPEVTSISSAIPTEFQLDQNYPNPFNPVTVIRYQIPVESRVRLTVFNTLGEVVKTLADGIHEAGYVSTTFDAGGLASGMYFYKIEATGVSDAGKSFSEVRKMLLSK